MEWLRNQYRWFSEQSSKFWLVLAFLLVSGLSFEAGLLQRVLREGEPVIERVPAAVPPPAVPAQIKGNIDTPVVEGVESSVSNEKGSCVFVGSKKSNKYHLPTSRCAKQIKPVNQICFDSVEAAKAKGYLPGCLE